MYKISVFFVLLMVLIVGSHADNQLNESEAEPNFYYEKAQNFTSDLTDQIKNWVEQIKNLSLTYKKEYFDSFWVHERVFDRTDAHFELINKRLKMIEQLEVDLKNFMSTRKEDPIASSTPMNLIKRVESVEEKLNQIDKQIENMMYDKIIQKIKELDERINQIEKRGSWKFYWA